MGGEALAATAIVIRTIQKLLLRNRIFMANTALYYPYINPPPDAWTTRSILYWDRIDSIIPWNVELADSTKALIDEGLLTPVDWVNVAGVGYEIADDFVRFIHKTASRMRPDNDWQLRFRPALIHTRKMPHKISEALNETGLGSEKSYDWWEVRPDIASAYMSTLAWCIAARNRSGCDLLTDRSPALDGFRLKCSEVSPHGRLAVGKGRGVLETVLKDLFLVPKEWLPPREVRLFKEQFGNELQAFRNHIDKSVLDLMRESGSADFDERLAATRNDFVTQTAALERRLAPSKQELVRKTILPSVVGVSAFLLTADYRLATALPLVLAGGEAILSSVMQVPDRQEAIATHPMAYAALFNDRMHRRGRSDFLSIVRRNR